MSKTVVERTTEFIADSAQHASRATCAVADSLIDDGVGVIKRAAKKGGDAAEQFLTDTNARLQRHYAITAATTFAVGFTAGAIVVWLARRK